MTALTRTTTLLGYSLYHSNLFQQPVFTGGENRFYKFHLDPEVWVDMGSPQTITVTVEPGDLLNAS